MISRAELEARLTALAPALDGMNQYDGIAVLLTLLDGIANTGPNPQQVWTYILLAVRERLDMMDDAADLSDCMGSA